MVQFSIVVPILNEEKNLEKFLKSFPFSKKFELILVDGGSEDRTLEIAYGYKKKFPHLQLIKSPQRGRGAQLSFGAACARGRYLLFLHADSHWTPHHFKWLNRWAKSSGKPAFFDFAPLEKNLTGLFLKLTVNARARWFRLPYGDQGLVMSKATYQKSGGYHPLPLFEDVDLVQRIKKVGKLVRIPYPLPTSLRRWEKGGGLFWVTGKNILLLVLYKLSFPLEELARTYYGTSTIPGSPGG